jgi:hypothetical protein
MITMTEKCDKDCDKICLCDVCQNERKNNRLWSLTSGIILLCFSVGFLGIAFNLRSAFDVLVSFAGIIVGAWCVSSSLIKLITYPEYHRAKKFKVV